jgi:hypothetical protein
MPDDPLKQDAVPRKPMPAERDPGKLQFRLGFDETLRSNGATRAGFLLAAMKQNGK